MTAVDWRVSNQIDHNLPSNLRELREHVVTTMKKCANVQIELSGKTIYTRR